VRRLFALRHAIGRRECARILRSTGDAADAWGRPYARDAADRWDVADRVSTDNATHRWGCGLVTASNGSHILRPLWTLPLRPERERTPRLGGSGRAAHCGVRCHKIERPRSRRARPLGESVLGFASGRDSRCCNFASHRAQGHRFGELRRQVRKKRVTTSTGDFDLLGAERAANPFFGERGRVNGVVQEPSPVVVPQVVIGIVRADAEPR